MLINQIGVEEEPTVVALRPRRADEAVRARRETLTDLLCAVWSAGVAVQTEEGGRSVTTLVPRVEDDPPASAPRRAHVA